MIVSSVNLELCFNTITHIRGKVLGCWDAVVESGVIGIDEIALKKGYQDYVVLVTARLNEGQVKLLAVLPDRKKKTLVKFLRTIPLHLRQTIHTVCTDMWEAYLKALRAKHYRKRRLVEILDQLDGRPIVKR